MKCKSTLYILIFIIGSCVSLRAETVSRKEAANIAETFFNAANGQKMAPPKFIYSGRDLTTHRLFSPFYVFNHPSGGFVVISAENKTMPILGFSLTDSFSYSNLPDALKALLTQYAQHAERIRYDSRMPDEAIDAWQNIPKYINKLLTSNAEVTDLLQPWEETAEEIAEAPYRVDIDAIASEIYTPQQWKELIDVQLLTDKNVPIGIASLPPIKFTLTPMVITGRKGDYYRLASPSPLPGFWLILSTEFISEAQLALLSNAPQLVSDVDMEIPFAFHEEFLKEIEHNKDKQRKDLEEKLQPTSATLQWHGTGHYSADLPEKAVLSRIYSITGALMQEQYYRDTNTAFLDISNAPNGIYFAIVMSESGKPYSFKLYR